MSNTQSFSLNIPWGDAADYLTGSGTCDISFSALGDNCVATLKVLTATSGGYATFNDAAKNALFPNAVAHPTSINIAAMTKCTSNNRGYIAFEIDGTSINQNTPKTTKSAWTFTSSAAAVTNCTKDSVIRLRLWKTTSSPAVNVQDYLNCTFYFTRYDLSAAKGTGVASASVSSANGYSGDTVTYTASLQSGYTFDGWYNGNVKISSNQTYEHTVSGDITLTAKATAASTATVRTSYNGRNIATETITPPVSVNYGGSVIASIGRGQSKTLNCSGKIMSGNVIIGGKTLNCNGKYMTDNITISVT